MQWIRRQFRSFFKLSNRPSDNQNVDKIHIPSSGVVADAVPAVGSFFVPISFSSTIVAIVASNIFQNNTIVSIPVYCVSPALHHPLYLSFGYSTSSGCWHHFYHKKSHPSLPRGSNDLKQSNEHIHQSHASTCPTHHSPGHDWTMTPTIWIMLRTSQFGHVIFIRTWT